MTVMTDQPLHQLTMTVLMTPDMANFSGNVHGGTVLKLLDQVAYACASRWAGLASVNRTGSSSMEVGVKVMAVKAFVPQTPGG